MGHNVDLAGFRRTPTFWDGRRRLGRCKYAVVVCAVWPARLAGIRRTVAKVTNAVD